MIALRSDCLLFQFNTGESIPCSAETISVEIAGDAPARLDPEMLQHAAASVFHYFKVELERETVTVIEFSRALEKVLHHFGFVIHASDTGDTDLGLLAREAADNLELLFFPRLRDELRFKLRQSPSLVRFRGLRGCVKQIAGARRWNTRCEQLQDQIVAYLRECLSVETEQNQCALVVE